MKIKTAGLAYLFIMLSCVRIEAFVKISSIDLLYDILKALGLVVAVTIYFRRCNRVVALKRFRISTTVAFWGWIGTSLLSVLVNKNNFMDALIKYMPFVSCFFMMKCVNERNDFKSFFSVVGAYFKLLAIVSFATGILFPQGIVQETHIRNGMLAVETTYVHLLGKANACGPVLVGMGTILILNNYINNKNTCISKAICLLPFLNIIIMGSSTAILGLGVFVIILLFSKFKKAYNKKKSINYYLILAIVIALTIGVVVYNIQFYFENLFVLLFNKDVTFSNRTYVWKLTIDYIGKHFKTLNYLVGSGNTLYSMDVFNGRYAHCHDQLFDIFLQSGIIGLFFYICMFGDALIRLVKQYNKSRECILNVVGAAIVSISIMFITEVYVTSVVLLLLMIAYYSDNWIEEYRINHPPLIA